MAFCKLKNVLLKTSLVNSTTNQWLTANTSKFGIALESLFETRTKFIASLIAFIANLKHAFICKVSWKIFVFRTGMWIYLWSFKITILQIWARLLQLPIYVVFNSSFKQVFACEETSYVKVSHLYKWWKSTLEMISFSLNET